MKASRGYLTLGSLTFGSLALLATAGHAEDSKAKKRLLDEGKIQIKNNFYCEKSADPAQSGCNTPDACGGPQRIKAKDKIDCDKQGGEWKQMDHKK